MSEQCAAAKKAWVLGCINKGREDSHKHSSCRLSISSCFPRITPPRFASLSHCPEISVCSAAPKAAIAHSAHAAQKLQKGGRGSGSPSSRDGSSRLCFTLISQGWHEQRSFSASRAPGFVHNHSHWLMQCWENVTPPFPSYAPVFIPSVSREHLYSLLLHATAIRR